MTEPCVGIILVNYRGAGDTIECIQSLRKMEYCNYFIVVVDNHSKDGSLKRLYEERRKWDFEIIEMDDNRGFAAGNNAGIRHALNKGAEYVLLLNNDTLVDPKCLTHLIRAHEETKRCGITIGKICYADERNKLWYAGGALDLKKGKASQRGLGKIDDHRWDAREEVSFATGCCMCIRGKLFEKTGLLDEDYFLYEEDVEFCHRVSRSKAKIIYEPAAVIFHKVSASTSGGRGKKMSPVTQYYMVRNRYIFLKRTIPQGRRRLYPYGYCLAMYLYYWLRGFMDMKYILWGIYDFSRGVTGKSKRRLRGSA